MSICDFGSFVASFVHSYVCAKGCQVLDLSNLSTQEYSVQVRKIWAVTLLMSC